MANRIWLPILLLLVVVLFACGQDSEEVTYQHGDSIPYLGVRSTEELILAAPVIVRAELLRITTSVIPSTLEPGSSYYNPVLEFHFRVHEYLKGSGPNEIVALVDDLGFHDTEAQARSQLARMKAAHDTRWDNRQAILFLSDVSDRFPSLSSSRPRLGYISHQNELVYEISNRWAKVWLPAASNVSSRSTATADPLFLLDAPRPPRASDGTRSTATVDTSTSPTISLSGLKQKISSVLAEANASSSPAWKRCIQGAYQIEREQRYKVETTGSSAFTQFLDKIRSGLPAGVVVWTASGLASIDEPREIGRHWFTRPHGDLFSFTATDFQPRQGDAPYILYTRNVVTARPLIPGDLQFGYNSVPLSIDRCGKFPNKPVELMEMFLTVTDNVPRGVLHESYFDPVTIGSSVGANGSNGVLKPNTLTIDDSTATIESLKWEDGAVTMTLNPTASLANYAIDFIDVNGTTTLSLSSDNASTTPLTWTVPDKPWSDGDLLMLRIHKPISNDATLSGLALSGVDITFSTATTTYTASVPATTTQTTVTPTTSHDSATYVVKLGGVVDDDGTIPLAAGDNVITIDVTAEDAVTTQTYTVTVTRATPSEPITVTLTPRVEGSETYVNITIEWNDPQPCDGQYMVALYSTSDYLVTFMGFHPAPATTSLSRETYLWWDLRFFPDRWAGVSCDPSDYSGRRELGRVSLRAAHPDNS